VCGIAHFRSGVSSSGPLAAPVGLTKEQTTIGYSGIFHL
jgi:hypothetical protein